MKKRFMKVSFAIALVLLLASEKTANAQFISASEIATQWRNQIVPNVECSGVVWNQVKLRQSEIDAGDIPANFRNPLHYKRFSPIGYRLEGIAGEGSLASTTNRSSITAYPLTDMMPLRMVTKYSPGKGGHESLGVTGAFMLWVDPMRTTYGKELVKLDQAKLQISDAQPFGPCIHVTLGKATVTLSQKWGWRVVSIADDANGAPVARQQFEYDFAQGNNVYLKKWTHNLIFAGIEAGFDIDSVTFGNVLETDIEVKIPPESLLTEIVNGEERQTVIRADGTERGFTAEEAVSGATWDEVINSETGKLPMKKRAAQKTSWTTIGLGLGGLMIAVAIILAIIKKNQGN